MTDNPDGSARDGGDDESHPAASPVAAARQGVDGDEPSLIRRDTMISAHVRPYRLRLRGQRRLAQRERHHPLNCFLLIENQH